MEDCAVSYIRRCTECKHLHTAATLHLSRGENPKVVQELLGHSTIALTMDTYSHVTPALHAAAAQKMQALFG